MRLRSISRKKPANAILHFQQSLSSPRHTTVTLFEQQVEVGRNKPRLSVSSRRQIEHDLMSREIDICSGLQRLCDSVSDILDQKIAVEETEHPIGRETSPPMPTRTSISRTSAMSFRAGLPRFDAHIADHLLS